MLAACATAKGPDVREDPDGHLGVAKHLLDHPAVGDDRALVVVARPQVQAAVAFAQTGSLAGSRRPFGILGSPSS